MNAEHAPLAHPPGPEQPRAPPPAAVVLGAPSSHPHHHHHLHHHLQHQLQQQQLVHHPWPAPVALLAQGAMPHLHPALATTTPHVVHPPPPQGATAAPAASSSAAAGTAAPAVSDSSAFAAAKANANANANAVNGLDHLTQADFADAATALVVARKPRKPYTATKTREMWSSEEHDRMVDGLRKYKRDWAKVTEFVGSRSAAQVRSHAQKYFDRVARDKTEEWIPRARPKRRSCTPYPRKASPPVVSSRPETSDYLAAPAAADPASAPVPRTPPFGGPTVGPPRFASPLVPTALPQAHLPGQPALAPEAVVQRAPSHELSTSSAGNNFGDLHRHQQEQCGLHRTTTVASSPAPSPQMAMPPHSPMWFTSGIMDRDPRMIHAIPTGNALASPSSPMHGYHQSMCPSPGQFPSQSSTPTLFSPYFMPSPYSYDPLTGAPIAYHPGMSSVHSQNPLNRNVMACPPADHHHPPPSPYSMGLFSPVSHMSYASLPSPASGTQVVYQHPYMIPVHQQPQPVALCPHGNRLAHNACPKCTALQRYGAVLYDLRAPQSEDPTCRHEKSTTPSSGHGSGEDALPSALASNPTGAGSTSPGDDAFLSDASGDHSPESQRPSPQRGLPSGGGVRDISIQGESRSAVVKESRPCPEKPSAGTTADARPDDALPEMNVSGTDITEKHAERHHLIRPRKGSKTRDLAQDPHQKVSPSGETRVNEVVARDARKEAPSMCNAVPREAADPMPSHGQDRTSKKRLHASGGKLTNLTNSKKVRRGKDLDVAHRPAQILQQEQKELFDAVQTLRILASTPSSPQTNSD